MLRFDDVEVVGARDLDELDVVAGCSSRICVSTALGRWHDVVAAAVDEHLRDTERQQRRREAAA